MRQAAWILALAGGAQATETTTFSYDALGRLSSSTISGGPATGVQSKEQDRDAICRLAQASDGVSTAGIFPVAPAQLCASAQAAISEGE